MELCDELHSQEAAVFKAVADTEFDLGAIAAEDGPELEGLAHDNLVVWLFATFDDRATRVLERDRRRAGVW